MSIEVEDFKHMVSADALVLSDGERVIVIHHPEQRTLSIRPGLDPYGERISTDIVGQLIA